ncbi:major facilitator superfamily transporter [Xylariaceae sp. FL0804]|nr:major facilitator superfamily transporter [Xylariaceae sp. FL0804]
MELAELSSETSMKGAGLHVSEPGSKTSSPESHARDDAAGEVPREAGIEAGIPPSRLALLCLGLCVGLFLSFLDTSIVATSLFSIGRDLGDLQTANWVALAYTLAYLGCAVLTARASDIVGRRDAFAASYVVFIAFSLGCGFARTMRQLIAFRALQGVGGSGLYSVTMIILPEIAPQRLRQAIGALVGVVIAISSVLGPVLGGLLTHYATWRWVFWINVPIGILSLGLFYLMWPKPQYLPPTHRRSWKELDYPGSVLVIAASVLVVFAFQSVGSGTTDRWSQAVFIAPLVVGLVAWVGLFAWSFLIEKRWGETMAAALPLRLLRNRVYASAVLSTTFLGFPYFLVIFEFPLRLQVVNGKDALVAGLMLLPMLVSSAFGSMLSGAVNGRKDKMFETMLIATCLMLLGCGLLSTQSDSQHLQTKSLGFLVFVGLGFGLTVSTSTMIAGLHSSLRDHASAQGIVAQVRVLGGSIGIAASTAIVGAKLREKVGVSVRPDQLATLNSGTTALTPEQLTGIRKAYADAFTEDMRVCTIIAGIAILFALGTFTRDRLTPTERRERQIKEEMERMEANRTETSGSVQA